MSFVQHLCWSQLIYYCALASCLVLRLCTILPPGFRTARLTLSATSEPVTPAMHGTAQHLNSTSASCTMMSTRAPLQDHLLFNSPCRLMQRHTARYFDSAQYYRGAQHSCNALSFVKRRHRPLRRDLRVCSGILQYLKDPTISPILTSTLIAAGTVSFNLVAGLVTEKKRADLTLEVGSP